GFPMPFLFSFSLLFFSTALIFLAIASFTDLKSRVVSNRLNYSMLALGIALHFLQAFFESNWTIFYFTIACVIATFLGSYLLWKLGVWAGGDVKLFTALAALVPLNPAVIPQALGYAQGIFAPLQLPVFPLTLFIFSIFSMLPLGVFIGVNGILKIKRLKETLLKDLNAVFFNSLFFALAIAGLEGIFQKLEISLFLIFLPLLAMAFLKERLRLFASVAAFAIGLFVWGPIEVLWIFAGSLASLFFVSAFIKVFLLSKREVLVVEKKVSRLEEGDIVAESVMESNGKILTAAGAGFSETFKYLKTNNLAGLLERLNPKGRLIADRHSAAGLTVEELKELKKLARLKKIGLKIKVKLSTPFVPGVLVAFLILAFISDVFWRVFFK
ncbi:MAG: A24 family peptidase C-terminal domain-containing protein, partial [Candidatus Diapherotrites archaeon]|nr:A24 family peptidase C-terminal domain-containing protein [Candidatus Diapherotrites archaeon]